MQRRALNVLIRIMETTQRLSREQLARRMDRELKIGPTAAAELVGWVVENRFLAVCPRSGDLCLDLVQEAVAPSVEPAVAAIAVVQAPAALAVAPRVAPQVAQLPVGQLQHAS